MDDKVVPPGEPVPEEGWIYLRLEGDAKHRGEQHGKALAKELRDALDVGDFMAEWDTGENLKYFAGLVGEAFGPLDDEYLDEIRGIVKGATGGKAAFTPRRKVPITEEVLIAWNAYNELVGTWWPLDPPQDTAVGTRVRSSSGRCSAFATTGAASDGGKIVMAHNTWDRYAIAECYNIILDIVPPAGKGHRVLMQATPGYITSGADWVVTDAGLMICETTIGSFTGHFLKGKTPEFQRSRKAAQYGDSIETWQQRMLDGNNGGYANTWLVGEAKSAKKRIARIDVGSAQHGSEERTDGYFACYNVASNLRVRNQETSDPGAYSDLRGNGARRVRFDQLLGNSVRMTAEQAQKVIADHHDVYCDNAIRPGSRSICGHLDLDDGHAGNHGREPFYPHGANDGKVMDSDMAANMTFQARWGNSCGLPFDAKDFLATHPQYEWLTGWLRDRPTRQWATFPPKR